MILNETHLVSHPNKQWWSAADLFSLAIHIENLWHLGTLEARHQQNADWEWILPSIITHFGLIKGSWDQLSPSNWLHNLQIKNWILNSFQVEVQGPVNTVIYPFSTNYFLITNLQVLSVFQQASNPFLIEGFKEVMNAMLDLENGYFIRSENWLMMQNYYVYVSLHVSFQFPSIVFMSDWSFRLYTSTWVSPSMSSNSKAILL